MGGKLPEYKKGRGGLEKDFAAMCVQVRVLQKEDLWGYYPPKRKGTRWLGGRKRRN